MTRSAPDWAGLTREIAGEVVRPDSPRYDEVRLPAIPEFESVRPSAVVRCATEQDVVAAISFARRTGLPAAVRGGGHCFAGRSSTEGIVIDVTPMREVSYDGGVVTVGAGARLGELYEALAEHGRTVPAGCGPTVGVAGLTLGGGIGILGRAHGLTCDHLLGARIVLADGRIVGCDEKTEPELFWALRGAGGAQFGVVTSLTFRTVVAPATNAFDLVWPHPHVASVINEWQSWAIEGPAELAGSLLVTAPADPAEEPVVHVVGAMTGDPADADGQLAELTARVGTAPVSATRVHRPYHDIKRYLNEHDPGEDRPGAHMRSKSELFARTLPAAAVQELVDELFAGRVAGESRALDFIPMGGAYNRVRQEETAFAHRDTRFLLKHTALVDSGDSAWLPRSWGLVREWGTGGVYPGFPETDLPDWPTAYHGGNYDRLVRVKAAYDPDRVFRFHQSLPRDHERVHAPA